MSPPTTSSCIGPAKPLRAAMEQTWSDMRPATPAAAGARHRSYIINIMRSARSVRMRLFLGAAALLLTSHSALAQGPAAPTPQTVDAIVEEANRRTRSGEDPEAVEAWMTAAMEQAGVTVKKRPEPWDVYGMARWIQENPIEDESAPPAATPAASLATPMSRTRR